MTGRVRSRVSCCWMADDALSQQGNQTSSMHSTMERRQARRQGAFSGVHVMLEPPRTLHVHALCMTVGCSLIVREVKGMTAGATADCD